MKQDQSVTQSIEQLYKQVQEIIKTSKAAVYRAANISMVQAYWNIGRLIVEEEQKGGQRAEYGKQIVEGLSKRLRAQNVKGYNKSNLWYMRQFYQTFDFIHAKRGELTWTHYRILLKVRKEEARKFYMEETIASHWNTRTHERQINSLYYERMLMSGKEGRPAVKQEAESKKEKMQPRDIIKDPFVLDFLDLKPNHGFHERTLEQALMDKLQEFLLEGGFHL